MGKGVATKAFLHAHGIEVAPEELDPMLREAISRLRRTLYRPNSRADLTREEARTLEQGNFMLDNRQGVQDPLAQTVAEYAALLRSSLSTADAAKRLGVNPSRIRQRLTSEPPTLYGIRIGSCWYIPDFQFDGDKAIQGLGKVVVAA